MEATFTGRRILIVDLGATFGGAEIYLENLLRQLPEEFTWPRFVRESGTPEEAGSTQSSASFGLPCATGAMKVLQLIAAAGVLPYLLIRHRIQTVQINGYAEIILIPLSRLLGRRAVATRHLSFEDRK